MILAKGNVERETKSEAMIALLKKEGFKELPVETQAVETQNGETQNRSVEAKPDLESMSLEELKTLAKEKEITGLSSLNKDQLKEVLKDMV